MGVDILITIEVNGEDDDGQYRAEVCTMDAGRLYHWADALGLGGNSGQFTFWRLRQFRNREIFDGTVKDTNLYCIMRALAKRYGKRGVVAKWRTG